MSLDLSSAQTSVALSSSQNRRWHWSSLKPLLIANRFYFYALPFIVFLMVVVAIPLWIVVHGALNFNGELFAHFQRILTSKFYLNSFRTTFIISLLSTIIGFVVALPIAIILRQKSKSSRHIAVALANIGANFAGFPAVMAFVILLGFNGVITQLLISAGVIESFDIYSFNGLLLTYCFFQISLALILLLPIINNVPKDLEEAAQLLGTNPFIFWLRIGFPMILRSLVAVSTLLFANGMGTYATAFALMGTNGQIITVRIGELVAGDVFSEAGVANALSVCLLIILLVPISIGQLWLRQEK